MRRAVHLVLFFACVTATSPPTRACAPAPPAGEQVMTQREDALIVWDTASHREHFVRRALFGGVVKEFGFLVPTPSRPELAEVDEGIFTTLERLTAPLTVTETKWAPAPVGCTMLPWLFLRSASKASEPSTFEASAVRLLEEKRVAGLDATVLEASSATALAAWLDARGFAFRPALEAWVEPYIRRGWTITAFRYAGEARLPESSLASRALRMSFTTDSPIYPYREPSDQPSVGDRELRLFLLASTALDAASSELDSSWPATLRFSAPLGLSSELREALSGVPLTSSMWLMEFRDRASKRSPVDLSFRAAAAPREVRPEPIIVYREQPVPIPYEAPLLLGGIGWWWQRRRKRRSVVGP